MHNFKKLDIWTLGMEICKDVYTFCTNLPGNEKYGLVSQIQRAAVSIPSNIAEGSSRSSNKDFARFLDIALGSSYEVQTQLMICASIFEIVEPISLISKVEQLQKQIYSFKNYLGTQS